MIATFDLLRKKIEALRPTEHYECSEDCWYSCLQHPDCCHDNAGEECTCGLEYQNARLDELLAMVNEVESNQ